MAENNGGDILGGDGGISFEEGSFDTQIKQSDEALHPNTDRGILALALKSRINKRTKPYIDQILARAVQRGKLQLVPSEQKYNKAEALAMVDMVTSIALEGKGREDLIEIVTQRPHFMNRNRFPGMGGNGGSYNEDLK